MSQVRRRILEVEILEDRCTPSTFGLPLSSGLLSSTGLSSLSSAQTAGSGLLPNGTPTSFAPILAGPNSALTFGPSFNFAAGSSQNLAEFPTPAASLILNDGLPNVITPGMFATGLGTTPFNINSSQGIESSISANEAAGGNLLNTSGLEVNFSGSLASVGLLLSNEAGVPSTAPFPLASYFEGLPLYDTSVPAPVSIQFESLSPFTINGMGRSSYEGSNGAGIDAAHPPPTRPANVPNAPNAPAPSPSVSFDWFFESEMMDPFAVGALGD